MRKQTMQFTILTYKNTIDVILWKYYNMDNTQQVQLNARVSTINCLTELCHFYNWTGIYFWTDTEYMAL